MNTMSDRITTLDDYKARFSDPEKRKHALELALDIRKFEIELYWKRTTYFWTLLAATFAGYFTLASYQDADLLTFLVSCIGLVLSTGWYLANRGSKYWQTNWERHVDTLEDEFTGPLYKTTISQEQFSFFHLSGGYPYSVSKVNQLISLFVVTVWLGIIISSLPRLALPCKLIVVGSWIIFVITAIFVGLLIIFGRGGSQTTPRPVDFRISPLPGSNDPHNAR